MKVINAKWVLLVVVLILLIFGFIFQTNFQWTSSHPSSLSFSIDEQLRSTLQAVSDLKELNLIKFYDSVYFYIQRTKETVIILYAQLFRSMSLLIWYIKDFNLIMKNGCNFLILHGKGHYI